MPVTTRETHPLKGEIICVDGPSASGKGTLAKKLARAYRLKFLDTGCLYRAVAYLLLQDGRDLTDEVAAVEAARHLALPGVFDFKHVGNNVFRVLVDGMDVTDGIRTLEVGAAAGRVAQYMPLRLALRSFQQEFAVHWQGIYGVVLDGRDTGGAIAPQARLKLMLGGDPLVRAGWRLKEIAATGGNPPPLAEVAEQLRARDERDAANMHTFPDTVFVDVTARDAAGVFEQIIEIIHKKFGVRPVQI